MTAVRIRNPERYDLRIVCTGGRDYDDRGWVWRVLERTIREHPQAMRVLIAQGGCPTGLDLHVRDWLSEAVYEGEADLGPPRGARIAGVTYPADWKMQGRRAGPLRNRRMLDEVRPHLVLVFPGGRGTWDCRTAAAERDLLIVDVAQSPERRRPLG